MDLFGDLLAGERLSAAGGEKAAHPLQGGGVETLAHLCAPGLRPLLAAHHLVNGPLVQAALLPGKQPLHLDKFVQGLAEPVKGEGLDQIVQHPPGQEALDDLPVVGGGDHDDGGVVPHGVQAVHKLQPVHGGGVVVQNDQIRAAVVQEEQGLSPAFAHLEHPEAGVALHILPVDGRHHGVVLNNDNLIRHIHASSPAGLVKFRVKQVPAPASVITSIVP